MTCAQLAVLHCKNWNFISLHNSNNDKLKNTAPFSFNVWFFFCFQVKSVLSDPRNFFNADQGLNEEDRQRLKEVRECFTVKSIQSCGHLNTHQNTVRTCMVSSVISSIIIYTSNHIKGKCGCNMRVNGRFCCMEPSFKSNMSKATKPDYFPRCIS